MPDRDVLHSDINCCYAQIECQARPELRGKPVVVGGDEEARHGIVLAKNLIAKRAGVKTAMALWEARKACPGLVVVPPDYRLYMDVSRRAREIYYDYTDRVEPFGPDEAWLDVTGTRRCLRLSPAAWSPSSASACRSGCRGTRSSPSSAATTRSPMPSR